MGKANNKNENGDDAKKEDPVKRGQEAIKMDKETTGKGKSKQKQDKEEEEDAEKWHNEG